jgi:hypothetical protein
MALTATYFLHCAREARDAARRSRDPTLSALFLDIARSYDALAENEEWLNAERPPGARAQYAASR